MPQIVYLSKLIYRKRWAFFSFCFHLHKVNRLAIQRQSLLKRKSNGEIYTIQSLDLYDLNCHFFNYLSITFPRKILFYFLINI